MTHKNRKKLSNFFFFNAGCSLSRGEVFSYRLDVLYIGLGISKLQFFIKKDIKKFQLFFLLQFLVMKTLDPDQDPDSLEMLDPNPDPQH
jgi:hypothetical protein